MASIGWTSIWIVSLLVEALLLARANPWSVLFSLVLTAALALWTGRKGLRKQSILKTREKILLILLQMIITGYAAVNWGEAWTGIDEGLPLLNYFFTEALWMPGVFITAGIIGYFFLRHLASSLLNSTERKEIPENKTGSSSIKRWGLCFVCALIPLTFCSENSLLYPLNDWVDVNCFMTVGKSWMHGMIPYRDILEQKGPYLYLIYGIASLISEKTFLGAWILEVISGTVFLYYIGRIASLYMGEDIKKETLLIPVFAVLVFTSDAFYLGGSTEEFCLPMLAYAVYSGLRFLKEDRRVSSKEWVIHGVLIGLILWSKFTVLGFYLGWVLFLGIFLLKNNGFRECFRMIWGILAGLFLITLPVIAYFGANHALRDLFEVYFYDNIFLYPHLNEGSPAAALFSHYLRGAILIVTKNLITVFSLLFLILFQKGKKRETGLLCCSSAILFLTSFIGKWSWGFYTLAFMPVAAAGIGSLFGRLPALNSRAANRGVKSIAITALLAFCILLTPNRGFMFTSKEETIQYQYAEIIQKSGIENPTLLQYGALDDGYYHAAGILPTCKAFCGLASPIPDVYRLQRESIDQGLTDFVVGKGNFGPLYEEIASGERVNLYRHK